MLGLVKLMAIDGCYLLCIFCATGKKFQFPSMGQRQTGVGFDDVRGLFILQFCEN